MNTVVFGAHPDDAEIGAGGVIKKITNLGYKVLLVIAIIPSNKEVRTKEAEAAAEVLGCDLKILDLGSEDLIRPRSLVGILDKLIKSFNPDQIFTHWNKDSHQDHISLTNGVIAATRKNQCSVYMYEQTIPGGIVPSGFRSQVYVDISNEIDSKLESTLAHKSQVKNNKESWIDGIKGRAKYHGYQIGCDYAETFELIKQIKKI
tara:strand:- start:490 stop:1101 length:612 start_codon:yes stop_codon:yes gene_type:complete